MAKYDCKSCHKTAEKFQGPSYNEISDKYAGQSTAVKYLSKKLIEGGVGVWGTIPMNPHPNMSQSDADEISKFILSINK
ncbi:MAG TPA: c-type cytochrome [Ferruginibacter sp.]|nr:c-type cytochrome [Ferruginibacter sp.]